VSAALRVLAPGPLTTMQDGGRIGWLRFGVPQSGALDPRALAVANLLVGNRRDAGALELTHSGGAFAAEGGVVRIALAGADMQVTIDGRAAACERSHTLMPGATLRIGPAKSGVRAYLAAACGFAVTPVFGSVSTHVRSGLGGLHGGALAAGDVLPLAGSGPEGPELHLAAAPPPTHPRVRIVLGPQDDHFTARAIEALCSGVFTVTAQSDRMGCRLAGPKLEHARGFNIVSDAIAPGSIQVPGGGQPIILLADRQTTGGYPKIATVISADLPALGQMRPGQEVRFEAVTLDAAVAARRALASWLDALPGCLVPLGALDSERLLAANLISGVTSGEG
jgi:5-oxoprolinase (ATP-hydrolysing) subunit C